MAELDPAGAALDALLARLGAPYELLACDPALADTAAFCAAYGYSPGDSANTIMVVGKSDPPRYAACVVLATTRLDVNHAVRARIGVKRTSFASFDEAVFGLPAGLPIWVDRRVLDRPEIILGGGSRSWKVKAPPAILLELPGVEIVDDLAFEPPPAEAAPTES
jgi:prolyl-tRNA editing enzyme YbaK/EbsC (Cys-tRNA(Pro) deacylase)